MTVEALLALYMPQRRALLKAGVPIYGWKVFISPHDSMDLDLELMPSPTDGSRYYYGATWHVDPDVPIGTIRIETMPASYRVKGA